MSDFLDSVAERIASDQTKEIAKQVLHLSEDEQIKFIVGIVEDLASMNKQLQQQVDAVRDELQFKATAYDAMCEVGLIQFDPDQPNHVYSVWGFGAWHHDEDILKAIGAAMNPPDLEAAIKERE